MTTAVYTSGMEGAGTWANLPPGFTKPSPALGAWSKGVDIGALLTGGTATDKRPLDFYRQTVAAKDAYSWFDDFYNRIYFLPSSVSFGAVSGDVSNSINIWNAYDRSVTLTSITLSDSEQGFELAGPSTPNTIPALGTETYVATAHADGPAEIAASIIWTFDAGTFVLPVTGSRVRLWAYPPNWNSASYQITYSFLTEIFTSRDGGSQRRALRLTPRQEVTFTATVTKAQFQNLKNDLWAWQAKPFMLPEMPRFVSTTQRMLADASTVIVDDLPDWLLAGSSVVLRSGASQEIRIIDTIDAVNKTLSFTSSTSTLWPVGTRIHRGLTGYMNASIAVTRQTSTVASVAVDFSVDPLSLPYVAPPAAETMFNGREVVLMPPNWSETISGNAQHDSDLTDYSFGPVARTVPVAFAYETKQSTYLRKGFMDAENLRYLFERARGRRGEFYMPTFEDDIPFIGPVLPTSAGLPVPGTSFAAQYAADTVHKAICIRLAGGTNLLRKVLSVTTSTDVDGNPCSLITTDAAFGVALNDDSVLQVCWMPVWIFGSDDLTIEWLTNTVAQSQITFQTVEDLAAETVPS